MSFNPYDLEIEPRYDPARHVKNFETPQKIESLEEFNFRTLRAGDVDCQRLANRLEKSWRGDPMLSPAKVSDLSAYRRWLGSEVLRLEQQVGDAVCSNAVVVRWQRPKGKLRSFDLRRELKVEKRFFERRLSSDLSGVLGVDFTLNTDSRRPGERFWQPHLHGVLFRASLDDIQALNARYPDNPAMTVFKPCRTLSVKDPFRQLSYLLKISFKGWKPTYDRTHPRERRPSLRADELRELLLFLGQFELRDLVLMHGVRRYGTELRFT